MAVGALLGDDEVVATVQPTKAMNAVILMKIRMSFTLSCSFDVKPTTDPVEMPYQRLATGRDRRQSGYMFTIEHEFDATVVTLVDDAAQYRQEDITITAFEDCVTLEQWDPNTDKVHKVTMSLGQIGDLTAALNLPEGVYQRATSLKKDQGA